MTENPPRCRNCGDKIHKLYEHVTFGPLPNDPFKRKPTASYPDTKPLNKDEAATISGKIITKVLWGWHSHEAYVTEAYYWNGEYMNPYFCHRNKCPIEFGWFAAEHTKLNAYEAKETA